MHNFHRLVLALTLAIALGACGGSAAEQRAGSAPTESATQSEPIEEFGMTPSELAVAVDDVEGRIETCMQTAGFEYVAADWPTVQAAMNAFQSAPGLADDEYIAQFGYGLSTQAESPAARVGLGPANVAALNALGPVDQEAYLFTLLGESPFWTFAIALEEEDFSEVDGCTAEAVAAVFDVEELDPNYVNPLDALVDNDPRVIQAIANWVTCMDEAGFGPFSHPDDAEDEVADRLDELVGSGTVNDLAGSELDALAELQGFERAIAAADEECDVAHVEPVADAVEEELEGK